MEVDAEAVEEKEEDEEEKEKKEKEENNCDKIQQPPPGRWTIPIPSNLIRFSNSI